MCMDGDLLTVVCNLINMYIPYQYVHTLSILPPPKQKLTMCMDGDFCYLTVVCNLINMYIPYQYIHMSNYCFGHLKLSYFLCQ